MGDKYSIVVKLKFELFFFTEVHLVAILVLNLFSALGAFMGLYIASALSEYDQFMGYMTAIAAGAFLYIAFMDMVHIQGQFNINYINISLIRKHFLKREQRKYLWHSNIYLVILKSN